jgi:hypothetical protein
LDILVHEKHDNASSAERGAVVQFGLRKQERHTRDPSLRLKNGFDRDDAI